MSQTPSLPSIPTSNAHLAQSRPLTAVFTGGTSGIDSNAIRALAAHYGGSPHTLRVYIVGRNAQAVEKIIADCSRFVCGTGGFEFEAAEDLAIFRNVDEVCAEEAREGAAGMIVLFMSHADLWSGGRRGELSSIISSAHSRGSVRMCVCTAD